MIDAREEGKKGVYMAPSSAPRSAAPSLGPRRGAELGAIYTPFFPSFRASIICFPFSVFIRTSTRPNEKFNLGKSD